MKYDFSGYATKNNIKCSDGRTILRDAFIDNNGVTVPLVWQHIHDDPLNVLGHALLENREDGVYCYCSFNDTEAGQNSKSLVAHGDITALSIYANKLQQQGTSVIHGAIKEVSLVLAGANPEALIDNLSIQHGDSIDTLDDEAIIYYQVPLDPTEIEHSAKTVTTKVVPPVVTPKVVVAPVVVPKVVVTPVVAPVDAADQTVQQIFDTLTDVQKNVVYALISDAMDTNQVDPNANTDPNANPNPNMINTNGDKTVVHSIEGGKDMKTNVFDKATQIDKRVLTHSEINDIFADAKKGGSLKDSVLAHAVTYGIENISYLFPDAKLVNGEPEVIKRDDVWVQGVLSAANHTPFSRIKSTAVDITADEARARGYLKSGLKKDEVIKLLRRITTPQTIYKHQKLDRDDIVDITDLDVVVWLKAEMRVMLNEEIARAILIGDQRSEADADKIHGDNIRPIYLDDELYAAHVDVSAVADVMVDDILRAKKKYKGSGNPVLYTSQGSLVEMLLIRDTTGRKLYSSVAELCLSLGVSDVVEVPVMEGVSRMDTAATPLQHDLIGIIVNLKDYTIGADKGGAINMFDDFDIDYNQQKYLIETRCSGALTKPYSAIVIEKLHTV